MTQRHKTAAALFVLLLLIYVQRSGGQIVPGITGPVTYRVVREATDDDHKFAQTLIQLRTGSAAEYFSQGGRRLDILDDDATDETGKQVIPATDLEGVTPPALLAYSKGKLVGKESLPKGASVQDVIAAARRMGG